MKVDIAITHGTTMYYPPVTEGITVEWERRGTPGKLTFKMVQTPEMQMEEGDSVRMQADGKDFFFGFVFTKKYNKEDTVDVIVYDQLRYLKNKHTYCYSNKTADQVVQMIAKDFLLKTGTLEPTVYVIPERIEDNVALFDIIGNALDQTILNTKKMYVLYDDCGKLCLKDVETMRLPVLLTGDNMGDYDYQSTIDNNVYNRIIVVHEDQQGDDGARRIYMAQNPEHIQQWGVLQYTDRVEAAKSGQSKADSLLKLYDQIFRTLSVKDVIGCPEYRRIIPGNSLLCKMTLGDITVQNLLMAESVKHTFTNNQHMMDMKLWGGIITGV